MKNFYSSITEDTLDAAIVFAQRNTNISNNDIQIIKHSRKHCSTQAFKKKSESCFAVTMGSHDGAKVCELVGIILLTYLTKLISQNNVGLYRDDDLIVVKNLNGQLADWLRNNIAQVFKSFGFNSEIETNLIQVDFLDVTFNFIKRHISTV